MIYIYFTGDYDDKGIKFISEDLFEFQKYVAEDYVKYCYDQNPYKDSANEPTYIQVWDTGNKCFKKYKQEGYEYQSIYIGDVETLEELIQVLEKLDKKEEN